MVLPIGIQLYSVREAAAKDYEGTIRAIADMGYVGVEPAGFPGSTPEAAAKLYKELDLEVPSMHCGMPIGEKKNETLDTLDVLGCKNLITGLGSDDFATVDKIKESCDKFIEASENAKARGFAFGIHNHWWEYQEVEGRVAYEYMEELLPPEVFYEIDTYWVTVAGQDAAEVVGKLGSRVRFLHIKDGPLDREKSMLAAGSGKMDFPPIVAAAKSAEYLIVELDRCDTDMMDAVKQSATYLIESGLGRSK